MTVYVARRDGAIYGVWTNKPADVVTEELAEDHADVKAFRSRPMPVPRDRVAELEARIAALEARGR